MGNKEDKRQHDTHLTSLLALPVIFIVAVVHCVTVGVAAIGIAHDGLGNVELDLGDGWLCRHLSGARQLHVPINGAGNVRLGSVHRHHRRLP